MIDVEVWKERNEALLQHEADRSGFNVKVCIMLSDANYSMNNVIRACCTEYGVDTADLIGFGKKENLKDARITAMLIIYESDKYTFKQIGNVFGGRDHSTVLYNCQAARDLLAAKDESFCKHYANLKKLFTNQ